MAVPDIIDTYFKQAKVRDNWLVGRGVMLAPPIAGMVAAEGTRWKVTVTGNGGAGGVDSGVTESHEFIVDNVVIGKFRPQITFVDVSSDTPRFIALTHLQPGRIKMLRTIPPGGQVTADEFMALTVLEDGRAQSNAGRRWRELRLEYGLGVSTSDNKQHYYRSPELLPIKDPQPRPDMNALNKAMVPQLIARGDPLECAKCTRPISEPGDKEGSEFPGVCDHRRPVAYGGSDELDNLQFLCVQCNNIKANVCRRCPLGYQCERCTWAYPHEFMDTVMVHLEEDTASKLKIVAEAIGFSPNQYVSVLIEENINTK